MSTRKLLVEDSESPPRRRFSGRRLAVAFTFAPLADALSIFLTLAPPVQWAADLLTVALLLVALGWQWILLPGLVAEAIPGISIFPFWVLVVGAVAMWGTARSSRKSLSMSAKGMPLETGDSS